MSGPPSEPFLSTRQVALLCREDESTIVYFAQAEFLPSHWSGTRLQFPRAEAIQFCEEWRRGRPLGWTGSGQPPGPAGSQPSMATPAGWPAGPSVAPSASVSNRAWRTGLETLNAVASVVSLATAVGFDRARLEGIVLAALNLLAAGLAAVRARARRNAEEAWRSGGAGDVAAAAWAPSRWERVSLRLFQVLCLLATGVFVGLVALALAPEREIVPRRGAFPTATATARPRMSPTPVATTRAIAFPTVPVAIPPTPVPVPVRPLIPRPPEEVTPPVEGGDGGPPDGEDDSPTDGDGGDPGDGDPGDGFEITRPTGPNAAAEPGDVFAPGNGDADLPGGDVDGNGDVGGEITLPRGPDAAADPGDVFAPPDQPLPPPPGPTAPSGQVME